MRVRTLFDCRGEIVEYSLAPAIGDAAALERQLRQDDDVKHRLRMAGIDPAELAFEERLQRVIEVAREERAA